MVKYSPALFSQLGAIMVKYSPALFSQLGAIMVKYSPALFRLFPAIMEEILRDFPPGHCFFPMLAI